MNKEIVEIANNYGFVVRAIEPAVANEFGSTDAITLENGDITITFISNVFHGTNYSKIIAVKDHHREKLYLSPRYFKKYIHIISTINGQTYLKLIAKNKESKPE